MKGDDVDDRIHVKTIKSTLGTHSIIQEIMCTVHWMQTFLLDKKKRGTISLALVVEYALTCRHMLYVILGTVNKSLCST